MAARQHSALSLTQTVLIPCGVEPGVVSAKTMRLTHSPAHLSWRVQQIEGEFAQLLTSFRAYRVRGIESSFIKKLLVMWNASLVDLSPNIRDSPDIRIVSGRNVGYKRTEWGLWRQRLGPHPRLVMVGINGAPLVSCILSLPPLMLGFLP